MSKEIDVELSVLSPNLGLTLVASENGACVSISLYYPNMLKPVVYSNVSQVDLAWILRVDFELRLIRFRDQVDRKFSSGRLKVINVIEF